MIIINSAVLYFLIFIVSISSLFIFTKILHNTTYFLDKKDDDKPQRLHNGDVRRIGGAGVFLALLVPLFFGGFVSVKIYHPVIFSLLPVFLIGFLEDFKRNIPRVIRILFVALGAFIIVALLHLILNHLIISTIPVWFAVLFVVFAIVGFTNALNLIDGINGLASGYAIISLLTLAAAAYILKDFALFNVISVFIVAAVGFFVLNYPKGFVFLGDSGSYILGFGLAVVSILLVLRNPDVSEWFVFAILLYPVFETIFSIYRRVVVMHSNPTSSDRLHLHTLLAKRVFRSNYAPTFFILSAVMLLDLISLYFKGDKYVLIAVTLIFATIYVTLYGLIVRFKAGAGNNA